MKKISVLIVFSFLFYTCNKKCDCYCDTNKGVSEKETQYIKHKYSPLDSLFYVEAYRRYGKPFFIERFTLSDINRYPYRNKLYQHFKEEDIQNDSIRILEATWDVSSRKNITVWYEYSFTKDIPIDTLFWDKGIE